MFILKNIKDNKRGRGGMVDTTDLKSVGLFGHEGSTPSDPIKKFSYLCSSKTIVFLNFFLKILY